MKIGVDLRLELNPTYYSITIHIPSLECPERADVWYHLDTSRMWFLYMYEIGWAVLLEHIHKRLV